MKTITNLSATLLAIVILGGPLAGMAADAKKEKAKPYPLKTCIISGDKLGEMGEPYVYVYEGREIKFCCKNCVKDFKKDPAKYLKLIDEQAAKEKKAGAAPKK